MKISGTGKRRFNQLIYTNLATPSGFSWNQLEPRNSNSPRMFWTDFVYCLPTITKSFLTFQLILLYLKYQFVKFINMLPIIPRRHNFPTIFIKFLLMLRHKQNFLCNVMGTRITIKIAQIKLIKYWLTNQQISRIIQNTDNCFYLHDFFHN